MSYYTTMILVPRREYLILLIGDVFFFALSLPLTLALRYWSVPTVEFISLHIAPFTILFAVWTGVFFLADLYGRHTRVFRSRLFATIITAQSVNIILAALFFFFVPAFGIAPRVVLVLYLFVSTLLIFLWRLGIFPHIPAGPRLKGMLIASGPDARSLVEEIQSDKRYPFSFAHVLDTKEAQSHEVIQHACRMVEEDDFSFLVVDFSDPALAAALPIVYDAAFEKKRFALVDIIDFYQEVFDRVPLSFVNYAWVLERLSHSRVYDGLKRVIDLVIGVSVGTLSLVFYPFIALAIKMDDGGDIFITQERIGRAQQPIRITKFRSMSGSDNGDAALKSKLEVTRVGYLLRRLRLDELPQFWSLVSGDLSFVGPRPELPSLAAHYSARIPYYNARYLMAPGLTGWAQIKHDRHPHHGTDVAATKEKLSHDLYYFDHRSLMLDLYIMLQTVRIVLTARGS